MLITGTAVELLLLAISLVVWVCAGEYPALGAIGSNIIRGSVLALPLLLINIGVLKWGAERWPTLKDFRKRIVQPVADSLSTTDAIYISLIAGIGEECFFRGVLLPYTGNIVSSIAFSVLHFGPAAATLWTLALYYWAISFWIGEVYISSQSLACVIALHAMYDFLMLMYLKHWSEKTAWNKPPLSG